MKTFNTSKQLRNAIIRDKSNGKRIAFVPTMGNLHEGHIQLVRKAKQVADIVVVSIFVNPLQFGAGEDLDNYPRTLAADKEKLFAEGTNYLLYPNVEEIYPEGMDKQTLVVVPDLSETLCGASRPGHFAGVATVVNKLFQIVQPDVAIFGKKDFQQLAIIEKMVKDLCMPIELIGVETARDLDGLALSSRNGYLTDEQRSIAPALHQTLLECREAIACGFDSYQDLEQYCTDALKNAGFEPDYFSVRDAETLREVTLDTEQIVILAAAKLGKPRLIDNVTLTLNPSQDWGMLATH
ncbi:pantoate--beta-alanine ligase [Oceanicoccus sp. KOV_DT_Chl]|uniref:pantoate--beta-alanine ligase n=1 Tax=Oceanicoccus sp. KOV_DT_Chl TaxID=1904639 RepID=UPI000C7D608D|nr:pantoate--beta-alanine ligase [Oceanicoccus sp. KOV_DT_Chl]